MTWMMPHQWVEKPHTSYERRRELRVRESKHTVILFDKKYQNIDTGKFNTDKLKTISGMNLNDIIQDTDFGYGTKRWWKYDISDEEDQKYWVNPGKEIPEHIPNDKDFDKECKLDDERKEREYQFRVKQREAELKQENEVTLKTISSFARVISNRGVSKEKINSFSVVEKYYYESGEYKRTTYSKMVDIFISEWNKRKEK